MAAVSACSVSIFLVCLFFSASMALWPPGTQNGMLVLEIRPREMASLLTPVEDEPSATFRSEQLIAAYADGPLAPEKVEPQPAKGNTNRNAARRIADAFMPTP